MKRSEWLKKARETELKLKNAPVGTLAPCITVGRWYRTERGWKWNGPDGSGVTFPRPGCDWIGELIYPEESTVMTELETMLIEAVNNRVTPKDEIDK